MNEELDLITSSFETPPPSLPPRKLTPIQRTGQWSAGTKATIMDIDDILADARDEPRQPPESLDLQELTRAWVAERVAPEILPYPHALMERVGGRIRKQVRVRAQSSLDALD